jgi:hypothetical protein
MHDSRYKWYLVDIAVFAATNIIIIIILLLTGYSFSFSLFTILILGLAVFRAADVISNEVVTKPLRAPFVDLVVNDEGEEEERPKKEGFRGSFGSLLYCPSCVGVWVATIFIYGYLLLPVATMVVASILSLSALERLFNAWTRQSRRIQDIRLLR